MAVVTPTEIIDLTVQVYGGVLPYEQCAFWGGIADPGTGPTPLQVVNNPAAATPGQPYVLVDNTLCIPPEGPWFIGVDNTVAQLRMNNFTGVVNIFTTVADASGAEGMDDLTFISGFFSFVAGLTDDPENQPDGSSTVGLTTSSRWVYE